MLQNACLVAKIGADTAENEQHFAGILPKIGNYPKGRPRPARSSFSPRVGERETSEGVTALGQPVADGYVIHICRWSARGRRKISKIGKISKICKFLAGSFSAVSKRNFARKYAFDSIFQALQNAHTSTPLKIQ